MAIDLPVYPPANLPSTSSNWGRETQARIVRLQQDMALAQAALGLANKNDVSTYNKLAGQVKDLADALNQLAALVESNAEFVDDLNAVVVYQGELRTYSAIDNGTVTINDDSGSEQVSSNHAPSITFTLPERLMVEIELTAQCTVGAFQALGSQLLSHGSIAIDTSGAGSPQAFNEASQFIPGTGSNYSASQSGALITKVLYTLDAGTYTSQAFYRHWALCQPGLGIGYFSNRAMTVKVLQRP